MALPGPVAVRIEEERRILEVIEKWLGRADLINARMISSGSPADIRYVLVQSIHELLALNEAEWDRPIRGPLAGPTEPVKPLSDDIVT